jgi:hypothetical protein
LLEKFVKLLQVNLFLAGFSHFEPLWVGVGEKASKTVEETKSTSGTSIFNQLDEGPPLEFINIQPPTGVPL